MSDETKRGKQPWQASLRTFAPRSLWPARSARSATTSPRRTVVTRRIVSSWRSTARAATSRRRTARPADGFRLKAPRNTGSPGFFVSACVRLGVGYRTLCVAGSVTFQRRRCGHRTQRGAGSFGVPPPSYPWAYRERREACEPSGPSSVSVPVNASCAREPFHSHVGPIGGGLGGLSTMPPIGFSCA